MKKPGIIIALVSILKSGLLISGCAPIRIVTGSGAAVSRDFDIVDFTHVQVSSAFEIEIIPSDIYIVFPSLPMRIYSLTSMFPKPVIR